MVVEPDRLANGKTEMRAVYEWIVKNIKGTAKQEKTHVIEARDIALFTSKMELFRHEFGWKLCVKRILRFSYSAEELVMVRGALS